MESIRSSYKGDAGSDNSEDESMLHLKPIEKDNNTIMDICTAPEVLIKEDITTVVPIDPKTKVLYHNPKYEELFAPTVGPENPFKTNQFKAERNTLAGFVEKCHVNDFEFENQRRTFHTHGYAMDPSVTGTEATGQLIGDKDKAQEQNTLTVFEKNKKPTLKRKRHKNDDAGDVEGYLGPWGKYENEVEVAIPSEEDKKYLEEYLAKTKKKGKMVDDKPIEEKSTLHLKEAVDYQGRSFMCEPKDAGVNLRSTEAPAKCFLPKRLIHTWTGHTKGVSAIKWFPVTAHLLLSSSLDSKIKLWQVYGNRSLVRTYIGHKEAVRDICFNNPGTEFLSCSYDRYIKLWDTETGACKGRFTNGKVPYCVKFHPEDEMQHLFVAGTKDKKILCWDVRSNEIVQDYDRHLGAVNTITFVDQNRRFVSTSDDKSLRVWEWDIPVDFKYIADPSMHSMPAVTLAPNGKWLACQSMDNQIVIFNAINKFKFERKKVFKGHMVAGYACGLDFSPEMSYLISGDGDGKLFIWDWKTTRVMMRMKAHDGVTSDCLWHPHETSKIVTSGWDGLIKLWD